MEMGMKNQTKKLRIRKKKPKQTQINNRKTKCIPPGCDYHFLEKSFVKFKLKADKKQSPKHVVVR